jgi:hypothetical protein
MIHFIFIVTTAGETCPTASNAQVSAEGGCGVHGVRQGETPSHPEAFTCRCHGATGLIGDAQFAGEDELEAGAGAWGAAHADIAF